MGNKVGPPIKTGYLVSVPRSSRSFAASWRAGVVRYDVDFTARTVAYYGCNGEEYIEAYPTVEVN
jgi:uncharacterized protein YbcV (DUF1398 family)